MSEVISGSTDHTAESKEGPEIADNQEKQQEDQEKTKENNKAALVNDGTDSHLSSDQPDFTGENKESLLESEEPKSKVMLWYCNHAVQCNVYKPYS